MKNREIKFRAFQDNKMLVSPISSNYGLQRFFGLLYEDAPIMQFTGLQDKNSKDIYEGDILQSTIDKQLFNWKVSFNDGGFVIQNIGIDGYLMNYFPLNQSSCFNRIIIGNIYENPELLKIKKA